MSKTIKSLMISGLVLIGMLGIGSNASANSNSLPTIHVTYTNLLSKTNHKTKHINLVHNKDYRFIKNYNFDNDNLPAYGHYKSFDGNTNVSFNHYMWLRYMHNSHLTVVENYGCLHGDPQSMLALPNGQLLVLFNYGHGHSLINRILEYNLRTRSFIRAGRPFIAGHGQGLAYNYKTHRIWMVLNQYYHNLHGTLPNNDLYLKRVSQNSLKPYGHQITVNSVDKLGENMTYDKNNLYYNVDKVFGDKLSIYRGKNGHMHIVTKLNHSNGSVIQNIEYNPYNNRLYVVCNGSILSLPINKITHLHNGDIHVAKFAHSEFETMAFYNHRAYLLVSPNQILKSNKDF